MTRPKISKTTVTFVVLHQRDDYPKPDEFWGEYSGPMDGELGYLMQEAWDGGMVGQEIGSITEHVPDDQVASELAALGNDGTFFDEGDDDV